MKKFIGDLSKADAELLERYAARARSTLEFGVGGSTQIIAQSVPDGALFTSIDTDSGWIDKTRYKLQRLGVENRCLMIPYENWVPDARGYDLIFNDGAGSMRLEFGLKAFPYLKIGGSLLFHDTRRPQDIKNVLSIAETFFEEIERIDLNQRVDGVSSNITAILKKEKEPLVSWNAIERKVAWQVGYGDAPEDFWRR